VVQGQSEDEAQAHLRLRSGGSLHSWLFLVQDLVSELNMRLVVSCSCNMYHYGLA
jgi:hypothetical protein